MGIASFNGKYAGSRLFIIGNGPSLNETPLDQLTDEYTFAVNRIDKIYPETSWRPSFYFYTWDGLRERDEKAIRTHLDLGIPCFINDEHVETFSHYDNAYFFDRVTLDDSLGKKTPRDIGETDIDELRDYWSDDVSQCVYTHHSTIGIMQVALYMGFEEIYFVGTDLGFEEIKTYMIFQNGLDPRFYEDKTEFLRDGFRESVPFRSLVNSIAYKGLLSSHAYTVGRVLDVFGLLNDPNHFSSGYRYEPILNHDANEKHLRAFTLAKRICDDLGVDVCNATFGGELEMYPRVEFDEIVST